MKREEIVKEVIRRLGTGGNFSYVARNPKAPPGHDQLPAATVWEFPDRVVERDRRSGRYGLKRSLTLVVEWFIDGTDEGTCSRDAIAYAENVRNDLFGDGANMGLNSVEAREVSFSRVLRPPTGEHVAGLGMEVEVIYVETPNA